MQQDQITSVSPNSTNALLAADAGIPKTTFKMEEAVLLKIKRQFTHDEAVAFLQSELAKAQFKNGELQSEIAELKHVNHLQRLEMDKMKKQLSEPRLKLTKEDLKEERFVELNKKLTSQGSKIKRLEDDVNLWRSKWLNLNAGSISR